MRSFKISCKSALIICLVTPWFSAYSSEIDFIRDVKPILEHNCISCHREDNAKGDIRLDTLAATLEGDDVLVPGDPDASSLYWTTTLPVDDDLFMPPIKNEEKDYPLTDSEKAVLKQWILDGADWPEDLVLEPKKRLPKTISFVEHVQPILELNCVACHYEGKVKGDLRLDTKEFAFATDYVISPGNALESDLYILCTLPQDDDMFMPPAPADPLSSGDLYTLRRWIDEGAEWPDEVTLSPKKKSLTILGTMPKDLYRELGFSAGAVQDDFSEYEEQITTSDLNFEMVPVKGGEFTMGSPLDDANRGEDEWPAHQVEVSDFWIGKHELTWDLYELWMLNIDRDNRAYKKLEETKSDSLSDAVTKPTAPYTDMTFGMGKSGYPAICMTQLSAKMYCMWLSARTGKFYRLPTEAEWEYACKAGLPPLTVLGMNLKNSPSTHGFLITAFSSTNLLVKNLPIHLGSTICMGMYGSGPWTSLHLLRSSLLQVKESILWLFPHLFILGSLKVGPGTMVSKIIAPQPGWLPKSHGNNKTHRFPKVCGITRMHCLLVFA